MVLLASSQRTVHCSYENFATEAVKRNHEFWLKCRLNSYILLALWCRVFMWNFFWGLIRSDFYWRNMICLKCSKFNQYVIAWESHVHLSACKINRLGLPMISGNTKLFKKHGRPCFFALLDVFWWLNSLGCPGGYPCYLRRGRLSKDLE